MQLKQFKFKHIPTGIEVTKDGDKYHFIDNINEYIRSELIENSNEWKLEIEGRIGYLYQVDNDEISFINEYTGMVYKIGDKYEMDIFIYYYFQ